MRAFLAWCVAAITAICLLATSSVFSQQAAKWQLNSSETCEGRRAIIERMGSETKVEVTAESIAVGEMISVTWSRGRFPEREPIYLMLSFDQPVRLAGEAFYGLMPNAVAAFEIGWNADRTRAVVPYYGLGAPTGGGIEVRPLLALPLTIRWAVIGYDGCREQVAASGAGEAAVEVRTSGAPEIVVNDPFALGAPVQTLLSLDRTRRLEIHEGRYRLLDAATGGEVAERVGTDPRFSPSGRFVAARGYSGAPGMDNFEIIDAIDGAVIVATLGTALGWDNHDSMAVVNWGGAGMIGTHDLLTGKEIPTRVWTNCRICPGTEATTFRADLENNVVIVIGPQGGRATNPSTHRVTDEFEWNAGVQHFRDEITSFINATSAVTSIAMPEVWEFRTGLRFSHVDDPQLEPFLAKNMALDSQQARQTSVARESSALVALNWRGLVRQSSDPCDPRERGLLRVEGSTCPETSAEGASTASGPVDCNDDQRGLQRPDEPCVEGLDESLSQLRRTIDRLQGIGFRVLAPSIIERFAMPAGDPQFIDTQFDTRSEEATRIQETVNERISAETGMPSELFIDRMNLGVSECHPYGEQEALKQFDVAWRWQHEGRAHWLTTHQCFAGSAAFMYPSTKLYSSMAQEGLIKLGDLTNPATNCGTCCDMSLDACGLDAKVFGDRLLIFSTKAAGFGVFDTNTGALLAKRFNLPRADLFENALLTEDGGHVVALNADGSFSAVRIADGETVLEGRYADDEVVVWTSDRHFDATSEGAHFVSFKFPGRIGEYTFQQFEDRLHVPGLVENVLSGTYKGEAIELAPPPSLSAAIEGGAEGLGDLHLSAQATGATPLADVQIYQDGLLTERLSAPADTVVAEWEQQVERLPGSRWISLVATDASGVASLPMGRDLGPDPDAKRRAHVLAIGVDRFQDSRVPPLALAEADARTFTEAISAAAGSEGSDLEVASQTLLLGDEASPARVLSEIEKLVTASARGETVAIFFAGHGVQGPDGAYYLATASTNVDDFPGTAVPWESIANVVAKANTRVAIFLDSCHSGMAGSSYFATNDDAAESILDRVPSGVVIFSASKGREEAGEDSKLDGGFFTKALESAIITERDETDRDGNGAIEISELFANVKRFVVERTEGKQTPWFARNEMVGDFALF